MPFKTLTMLMRVLLLAVLYLALTASGCDPTPTPTPAAAPVVTLPATPTGLMATLQNNGTSAPFAVISWNAVVGATSYNVYRSAYANPAAVSANFLTATACEGAGQCGQQYPVTTGTYYYSVTAVNSAGESAPRFTSPGLDVYTCPGDARCGIGGVPVNPVVVQTLNPTFGQPNTSVTITGSGFNPVAANNAVTFNNIQAIVTAASATVLTVLVPANAPVGSNTVVVSGVAAGSTFIVLAPPTPVTAPPTPFTQPATAITQTSATLNGAINPNGQATSYSFAYGTSPVGAVTTQTFSLPAGATSVPVSASVSGLMSGTFYYYQIVATNATGNASSAWITFNTNAPPAQLPQIQSSFVTGTASNGATINVSVNPNGAATTVWMDYGTTTGYGSMSTSVSAGSGNGATPLTIPLSALAPNTLYHFRVQASSANGTAVPSADQTFTTQAPPVVLPTAPLFAPTAAGTPTPLAYCSTLAPMTPAVFLKWSGALPVNGHYKLERISPVRGQTVLMSGGTNPNLTTTTFDNNAEVPLQAAGLQAGSTYQYRVSTFDSTGLQSTLPAWTAVTIPAGICTGCVQGTNSGNLCRVSGNNLP